MVGKTLDSTFGAVGATFQVIFFNVWPSLFTTAMSQATFFR